MRMLSMTKKALALCLALCLTLCLPALAEEQKTPMTPGTYTGSANGMNDKILVEVAVTEDAITSITVTYEQETPGIGGPLQDAQGVTLTAGGVSPVDAIPAAVVEAQTLAVDGVTGATITTRAILAAAKEADVAVLAFDEIPVY